MMDHCELNKHWATNALQKNGLSLEYRGWNHMKIEISDCIGLKS